MFLLVSLILSERYRSDFCTQSLTVNNNKPQLLRYNLDEGEFLCIETEVPYLTVIFEPDNLLSIKIFKRNENELEFYNETFVPGLEGGITFGKETGALFIEPLLSGEVQISVFAYPEECENYRFVTNLDSDIFSLHDKIPSLKLNTPVCVWMASLLHSFRLRTPVYYSDEIELCQNQRCSVYMSDTITKDASIFYKITPTSRDFESKLVFEYNSSLHIPTKPTVSSLLPDSISSIEIKAYNFLTKASLENVKHNSHRPIVKKIEPVRGNPSDGLITIIILLLGILCFLIAYVLYTKFKNRRIIGEEEPLIQKLPAAIQSPYPFPQEMYPPYGYPTQMQPTYPSAYFPPVQQY